MNATQARQQRTQRSMLAHLRSDDAVDLLGAMLQADLETLRPGAELQARSSRALDVCTLLGRAGNPRAVRWLTTAADRIDRQPDLVAHIDWRPMARSMLQFKEQTKDRIAAEIESGDAAGVWAGAVADGRDPYFLNAIRAMLRRDDMASDAMSSGVIYLWNLDSPEAVEALREVYDRGVMRHEPRLWSQLCQALAARGDSRGLGDAYKVLVSLERPAEPPAEEQPRRDWRAARDDQRNDADRVFDRASKEILADFILRQKESALSEERRVVLRLLWKLPELPAPIAAVIARWVEDTDRQVAELARRLLDRG